MSECVDLNECTPEQLLEEMRARFSPGTRSSGFVGLEPVKRDLFATFSDDELFRVLLRQQKLVYGGNARFEACRAPAAEQRDVEAVGGVFSSTELRMDPGGASYSFPTRTFSAKILEHFGFPLADGESFAEQPVGPRCTACLVGPDLVLTLGRAVNQRALAGFRFVFGFGMQPNGAPPSRVSAADVFTGVEIIDCEVVPFGEDWALIRLDRPAVGRRPARLRRRGRPVESQALHVIGHPQGLPLKVACGATVRENLRWDSFVANVDTFGGSAGSPVFNSDTHEIEGLLVRGSAELVRVNDRMVSLICPEVGCLGGICTRAPVIPLPGEEPGVLRLRRPYMRSAEVRRCQQLLGRQGFSVPADGVFGPKTRAAVKALQRRLGLEADGIIDHETHNALIA